jgi:hypothetical protein
MEMPSDSTDLPGEGPLSDTHDPEIAMPRIYRPDPTPKVVPSALALHLQKLRKLGASPLRSKPDA